MHPAGCLVGACWILQPSSCCWPQVRKARYSSRGACADRHFLVIRCSIILHNMHAWIWRVHKEKTKQRAQRWTHTLRHVWCRCASVLGRLAGRPCISVAKKQQHKKDTSSVEPDQQMPLLLYLTIETKIRHGTRVFFKGEKYVCKTVNINNCTIYSSIHDLIETTTYIIKM